jgi:hypothetical protein
MKRLFASVILGLVAAVAAQADTAGGLKWTAPSGWTTLEARPMRAVTYRIPAARGDKEDGELAVFYFGVGGGGGVDANVKRWVGQFQKADGSPADAAAKIGKETIAGLPVTTVDVKGTYAGGGMMGASTPKPGYRMIGAIAEGPEGGVFFKLTGPENTVAAAEKPFRGLLAGMKK